MFAIETLQDRDLVGACGLCYLDWVSRTAELSIYIGAQLSYVDHTFAPDACRVLLSHAFLDLNFHRVWTEVFSFDERKRELLERLGFTHEGTLRDHRFHGGGYHDSLLFGLTEADWPDDAATLRDCH
jgi:RimJ/RimL family protein N-acetyltransferase